MNQKEASSPTDKIHPQRGEERPLRLVRAWELGWTYAGIIFMAFTQFVAISHAFRWVAAWYVGLMSLFVWHWVLARRLAKLSHG